MFKNKREFFKSLTEGTTITAEQAAFAVSLIDALDKSNDKRRTSKAALAEQALKDEFRAKVFAVFTAEPTLVATETEFAAILNDGTSHNKAGAALRFLASDKGGNVLTSFKKKVSACRAEGRTGGEKTFYKLKPQDETPDETE